MRWVSFVIVACIMLNLVGCDMPTSSTPYSGVVLIDPGHGGFDGGASAEDGTIEKHLNLAIAQALRDMLYVCGVSVEMTRSTDVGLEEDSSQPIRNKKVSDMRRRLALYNEAALVISIHQNHFSIPKYCGTQVFYAPHTSDSAALAEAIRRSVVDNIQIDNKREVKQATESIYLLYHTHTPAVLVECGFLSNPEEREKLKTPVYQQQLAFAIVAGYWELVR